MTDIFKYFGYGDTPSLVDEIHEAHIDRSCLNKSPNFDALKNRDDFKNEKSYKAIDSFTISLKDDYLSEDEKKNLIDLGIAETELQKHNWHYAWSKHHLNTFDDFWGPDANEEVQIIEEILTHTKPEQMTWEDKKALSDLIVNEVFDQSEMKPKPLVKAIQLYTQIEPDHNPVPELFKTQIETKYVQNDYAILDLERPLLEWISQTQNPTALQYLLNQLNKLGDMNELKAVFEKALIQPERFKTVWNLADDNETRKKLSKAFAKRASAQEVYEVLQEWSKNQRPQILIDAAQDKVDAHLAAVKKQSIQDKILSTVSQDYFPDELKKDYEEANHELKAVFVEAIIENLDENNWAKEDFKLLKSDLWIDGQAPSKNFWKLRESRPNFCSNQDIFNDLSSLSEKQLTETFDDKMKSLLENDTTKESYQILVKIALTQPDRVNQNDLAQKTIQFQDYKNPLLAQDLATKNPSLIHFWKYITTQSADITAKTYRSLSSQKERNHLIAHNIISNNIKEKYYTALSRSEKYKLFLYVESLCFNDEVPTDALFIIATIFKIYVSPAILEDLKKPSPKLKQYWTDLIIDHPKTITQIYNELSDQTHKTALLVLHFEVSKNYAFLKGLSKSERTSIFRMIVKEKYLKENSDTKNLYLLAINLEIYSTPEMLADLNKNKPLLKEYWKKIANSNSVIILNTYRQLQTLDQKINFLLIYCEEKHNCTPFKNLPQKDREIFFREIIKRKYLPNLWNNTNQLVQYADDLKVYTSPELLSDLEQEKPILKQYWRDLIKNDPKKIPNIYKQLRTDKQKTQFFTICYELDLISSFTQLPQDQKAMLFRALTNRKHLTKQFKNWNYLIKLAKEFQIYHTPEMMEDLKQEEPILKDYWEKLLENNLELIPVIYNQLKTQEDKLTLFFFCCRNVNNGYKQFSDQPQSERYELFRNLIISKYLTKEFESLSFLRGVAKELQVYSTPEMEKDLQSEDPILKDYWVKLVQKVEIEDIRKSFKDTRSMSRLFEITR